MVPLDSPETATRRVVRAACPHDCPDTCAMLVTVENGRAIEIKGAPDHPTTGGTLCTKVARYLDRTYSPDRLRYPMRRVGAKGEGRFARISWDEALDEIATRFKAIAESTDGPQAILPYSYAGTMGLLQGSSMDRRFFHRLGASLLDRTICAAAGKAGWAAVDRRVDGHGRRGVRRQPADPDLGQQSDHVEPAFLDARAGSEAPRRATGRDRPVPQRDRREVPRAHRAAARHRRGARVRHHASADRQTAMDRSRLRRPLHDRLRRARASACASGRPIASQRPAASRASRSSRLAHDYGTTKPAAIRLNYGMQRDARRRQRRARGGVPARARRRVARSGRRCAAVVVGDFPGRFGGARAAGPDPRRAADDQHVGDRRCAARRATIRRFARFTSTTRIQWPSRPIRRASSPDFRATTCSASFTRSSRPTPPTYADILLPATTQLEQTDVHSSYGHLYALANNPAIAPIAEALPNTEVFRRLAARMGFTDAVLQRKRRHARTRRVSQATTSARKASSGIR